MSNQNSVTVTDVACKTTSKVYPWVISGDPINFATVTPGAGSFVVATPANRTGLYGYQINN
jgi:hypothetical protein